MEQKFGQVGPINQQKEGLLLQRNIYEHKLKHMSGPTNGYRNQHAYFID